MVYAVGPNCDTVNVGRAVDRMDVNSFLEVVQTLGAAIVAAIAQYNREAEPKLPRIEIVRICLLCGGSYRHPGASKMQVARSLIQGLVQLGHQNKDDDAVPCLDFAWDDDVFSKAWHELGLEVK